MSCRKLVTNVSPSTIFGIIFVSAFLLTSASHAQKPSSEDKVKSGKKITVAGWATKSKIAAAWLLYPNYIKMNVVGSYAYPYYVRSDCTGAKLKEAVASAVALVWRDRIGDDQNYTSGRLFGSEYNSSAESNSKLLELALDNNALCSSEYREGARNCRLKENTTKGREFECLFLSKKKLLGIEPKAVYWIDRPSYTFYETKFGTKAVKKMAESEKFKSKVKKNTSNNPNVKK